MAYIFVGSYTKFEVDGSVRYRDIAINVKWGKKKFPPPPAACALIVCEIYGSYLSIMWCYYLGIVNFKYDKKHDLKVQIANDWGRSFRNCYDRLSTEGGPYLIYLKVHFLFIK